MEPIYARCLELWQACAESFTTTNLQIALLIGSGILAIALLVLALTRWGQSRPVWKCVILSFVAHILLLGYAYGTHLIFENPPIAKSPDPLRVNLVEDIGETAAGRDLKDAETKPWEEFVSQTPLPDVESLERPIMDSELVIERVASRPSDQPSANITFDVPETPIDDVVPPVETDFQSDDFSPLATQTPELAAPTIDVPRRDESRPDAPETPAFDADLDDLEPPSFEQDFQPIEKEDFEPETESSDASKFSGDLVSPDARLPLSEPENTADPTPRSNIEFREYQPSSSANRMRLVSNPRRLADGQPMPKIYSLRNVANRLEIARKRGGSAKTEQAVNLALRWLAQNQQDDGRWDPSLSGAGKETMVFGHDRKGAGANADCGITGLATLAFLAAGHTHLEGPYQNEIRKSLEFLARQQKKDGNLSGNARLFARMYCHSMSLLALSETLAMTGDQRLYQPVQRGVDYSLRAQNRRDGGWRYQPGDTGDMSQFGWQVLALHSAQIGGAVIPSQAFDRMELFLDQCSSGVGNGLASYRPGQGPSTAMTAEALLCRYFLKDSVTSQTLLEATRQLAKERPSLQQVNLYYWYYGTLALYHVGGDEWQRWNEKLKQTLLELQIKSGPNQGAWPANGLWAGYGGQVYATAMAALNLEVYYRYLPMYDVAENRSRDRSVFR